MKLFKIEKVFKLLEIQLKFKQNFHPGSLPETQNIYNFRSADSYEYERQSLERGVWIFPILNPNDMLHQ